MRYLKKFNEADFWSAYRDPNDPEESRIKNHDILQDLNDISYEIKDDGYDFDIKEYYYQPKGQTFIICNILPGKYKSKRVSDAMIDTILRMVDYMHHNSYDCLIINIMLNSFRNK